jgi:hypothetical protein
MRACKHPQPFLAPRRGNQPGWWYLGRCAAWLQHGGWVYLSWRWLWQFAVVSPRARGWHWG